MRRYAAALAAFALGATVALACTPTLWSGANLAYNIGQLDAEAQGAPVLHLYSTRDGFTGHGQFVTGFRFVCYIAVQGAPADCALAQKRHVPGVPGPGPGPCYVAVVDWGQEDYGYDLTAAYCESIEAGFGLVVE